MLRAIKVKILILKVSNFYFPSKLNLYLFVPFFCKRFCLPSCKTIISLFQNSLFSKMYLNHSVFEFLCWLNFKKQDIIWQNYFLCSQTNLGIWEIESCWCHGRITNFPLHVSNVKSVSYFVFNYLSSGKEKQSTPK